MHTSYIAYHHFLIIFSHCGPSPQPNPPQLLTPPTPLQGSSLRRRCSCTRCRTSGTTPRWRRPSAWRGPTGHASSCTPSVCRTSRRRSTPPLGTTHTLWRANGFFCSWAFCPFESGKTCIVRCGHGTLHQPSRTLCFTLIVHSPTTASSAPQEGKPVSNQLIVMSFF